MTGGLFNLWKMTRDFAKCLKDIEAFRSGFAHISPESVSRFLGLYVITLEP